MSDATTARPQPSAPKPKRVTYAELHAAVRALELRTNRYRQMASDEAKSMSSVLFFAVALAAAALVIAVVALLRTF